MSAPPDGCPQNQSRMSAPNHQEHAPHAEQQGSNVRHIPIFVEGRDEPVINKSVDHGTHFGEAKPAYVPPPQPHVDREQYYDDGPAFHPPPNFSRAFGTPFNKGPFRQGPQPFTQQKVYPQSAFGRGPSPQRSQSPKPASPHQHPDEFVKVPVHHDQPQPQQQPQQQQHRPTPPPQQAPPKQQTPPPQPKPQEKQEKPAPASNDPITQILSIQTDVLNLMSEVENFTGSKKDKKYLFLDEMLTRNLIKLDNIETDGKENIRQARKEAIKCIQKCIAVLEAKADKGGAAPAQDVVMQEGADAPVAENGEVEMNEAPKPQEEAQAEQPASESQEEIKEVRPQESTEAVAAVDTRPSDAPPAEPAPEEKKDAEVEKKASPKKGGKNVKKRDKSKDNKDKDTKDSDKEPSSVAKEGAEGAMEVDGAASQ